MVAVQVAYKYMAYFTVAQAVFQQLVLGGLTAVNQHVLSLYIQQLCRWVPVGGRCGAAAPQYSYFKCQWF